MMLLRVRGPARQAVGEAFVRFPSRDPFVYGHNFHPSSDRGVDFNGVACARKPVSQPSRRERRRRRGRSRASFFIERRTVHDLAPLRGVHECLRICVHVGVDVRLQIVRVRVRHVFFFLLLGRRLVDIFGPSGRAGRVFGLGRRRSRLPGLLLTSLFRFWRHRDERRARVSAAISKCPREKRSHQPFFTSLIK